MENEIVTYDVGQTQLSLHFGVTGAAMEVMDQMITAKASANLEAILAEVGDSYSVPEKRAMLIAEEIKLTNDFDLMKIIQRGKRLIQIRDEGLWSMHPNGYTSLENMSKDLGISVTELSNTITLYEVVFPWLTERGGEGFDLVTLFEDIGKANLFEIIPYLRALITGEPSQSDSVNERVNEIINQINELAPGMDLEEITARAVDEVLEAGRLPNRQMRAQLRPNRTPAIEALLIQQDGTWLLSAELTDDQRVMLQRILKANMDEFIYVPPEDQDTRRRELLQLSQVRKLVSLTD